MLRFRLMMNARSASAASSIRRRSAAWPILLDSMCRSRKRASASWMMRARSCGKRGWRVNLTLSCRCSPSIASSELGWKPGPLSQWLYSVLAEAGLPVICVETRHMRAMLKAQINKTDRNDARGISQMMRVGLYRPVHVKTLRSQKLRMLLTHRKLLQSKAIAVDNDLRATLRNFGLKVGIVGTAKFEARIKELVENLPDLAELVEPLLIVRRRYANRSSS